MLLTGCHAGGVGSGVAMTIYANSLAAELKTRIPQHRKQTYMLKGSLF